ncbi:DUF3892 domain-containing protein [Cohnella lubricantis]|uniref:DUF3892 domain-containing protein n=1 Tax=Cohnella lubricantis TaxID=2163172 RepID=A0A841T901_9BACL|nr:DUF3892 domain-containing protein [Cohnella lubricantis]MBB6676495.1 DUF3892 domain-containing protein [Cohnella lubricantis]MBP2117113.1 hypothetical protein [Cohnella lubricantis]
MAGLCQITHIRLSNSYSSSTEHITHVKLSTGTVETREQAVSYIDIGYEYYYTNQYGSKANVETVHPTGRPAYIRTKANTTTVDNLLSLPRF